MVQFSLDVRATRYDVLMKVENELKEDFASIAKNGPAARVHGLETAGKGCEVEWILDSSNEATKFDKDCINCVEESTKEMFGDQFDNLHLAMTSGAGHDSVSAALILLAHPRCFGLFSSLPNSRILRLNHRLSRAYICIGVYEPESSNVNDICSM